MFSDLPDIFSYSDRPLAAPIAPAWQPTVVDREHWPPNYLGVYAWRMKQLSLIRADVNMLVGAKAYYKTHYAEFIMHWMDTYDPRKRTGLKWVPFVFFPRQMDFCDFLNSAVKDGENGLVEKSRDMGATWEACAWSVCDWLFEDQSAIGWGSRKQELVDQIGNVDSIFEKLRMLIRRLPAEFLPSGFDAKTDMTSMRIINRENGSTITGEIGDNIGRGGRKRIYFKDESAHYERPQLVEAALGDNTNVQIDISSVHGIGNVFYNKRKAGALWYPGAIIEPGQTRVFVMDWREHPEKTQAWYDRRKRSMQSQGLDHIFAQEVDRNYSASISNTVIPAEWLEACVDAHVKLKMEVSDVWGAGLDVADGGGDTNALAVRQFVVLRIIDEWGSRDVGVTARRAINACRIHRGIRVQYDIVGVGSTVKAEFNRLTISDDPSVPPLLDVNEIRFVPWNAGGKVLNKFDRVNPDDDDSVTNDAFFHNMKAQAWWSARTRVYKTFQAVTQGAKYDHSELISFDSTMPHLPKLLEEMAQPTYGPSSDRLKMVIEKKPDGAKSPNLADAVVMCYFPVPDSFALPVFGTYGNA